MKVISEPKPADTTIPVSKMKDGQIGVITSWGDYPQYIGRGVQRFGDDLLSLRRPVGGAWSNWFGSTVSKDVHRVRLVDESQPFQVDADGKLTLVDTGPKPPEDIDATELNDGQVAVVSGTGGPVADAGKPVQRVGPDLVILGEPKETAWKSICGSSPRKGIVRVRPLAPGTVLEL
jgi:hypothetical protein